MAAPIVVASLRALDREITSVAPKRTLPTWYKGDAAHQTRPSGHNPDDTTGSKAEYTDSDSIPEIRAGDYRLPLNSPDFTAEQLVQYLVEECRAGRITWISYIIFNKRIWHHSDGFKTRTYTGSNPHDKHFHISTRADSASESNTKAVGLVAWVARLKGNGKGSPKMIEIDSKLPELRRGMADGKGDLATLKTSNIKRAQAVLVWLGGYSGKIDGDYGPVMAAAVKKMMADDPKRSSTNGAVIGRPEFARMYGLW